VVNELSLRLVPDAFWEIVEPLVPDFDPRPQGGGTAPLDKRSVFTAIVYVLTAGCAWRRMPAEFGASVPTAQRRFTQWAKAGVFATIHRAVLDRFGAAGELDWSSAILDAAHVRAKKGARALTGPSPVDRGKPGSKLHVLCETPTANGCARERSPHASPAAASMIRRDSADTAGKLNALSPGSPATAD